MSVDAEDGAARPHRRERSARHHARGRRITYHLLAILAAATALVASTPSSARSFTQETIGGTAKQWLGSDRCRGAKLRAHVDSVLLGFDLALSNTAGGQLDFYVYEAATESGTYAVIDQASTAKIGSLGTGFDWEPSPPLYAQMRAGNYYVVLTCWGKDILAGYRGEPAIAPRDLAFGEYLGGVNYSKSGTPPPGLSWSTTTNDYLARIYTSPGEALVTDTKRPYYGPFVPGPYGKAWGNIYRATETVVLLGFDQLFAVAGDTLDALMNWYVYRCPRRAGCTKGLRSWNIVSSGSVPVTGRPLNTDQWIGVDGLRIPLQAGDKYWVGFSWADPRVRAYRFTSPDVDPFFWGRYIAHAMAGPIPLRDPERFRTVFNAAQPQHLLTIRPSATLKQRGADTPEAAPPASTGEAVYEPGGSALTRIKHVVWGAADASPSLAP